MADQQATVAAATTFLHLGHQCPYAPWFRSQVGMAAEALALTVGDFDLTGNAPAASAAGAYGSMQWSVPGRALLAAPEPAAALLGRLAADHVPRALALASAGRRPGAASLPVTGYRAGEPGWTDAVESAAGICLGLGQAAAQRGEAVQLKLAWLASLDGGQGPGPVLFLAGRPGEAVAFVELIPGQAAHAALPYQLDEDLFLTCLHGKSEAAGDHRPPLLRQALALLSSCVSGIWTVSGRNGCYPNGPVSLFLEAGFREVAGLGHLDLSGGSDELVLLRWDPGDARRQAVGLLLDKADNVATLPEGCAAGDEVRLHGLAAAAGLCALDDVPAGHKIAVRPIARGSQILKYGQPIGRATADIRVGQHVHVHNLVSDRAGGEAR